MRAVMSSRERVYALLRREPADRMGLFEHFWPETIGQRWVNEGYPKDASPPEYFDFDLVSVGWGLNAVPLKDFSETIRETEDWIIIKNGRGATLRTWKNKSGAPEHIAFDCSTRERWEKVYKPPLLAFDPGRVNPDAFRSGIAQARENGRFCFFGCIHVYELMRGTLGDVVMLQAMALEPDWIHDFCRTYTDFYIKHLDYLFAEAGQPDGAFVYEDLGYKKGLFCSPRMYRDLIMPYYKELFDYLHARGMPVLLHTCGGITEAVPDLIEAGIDCLQPMEVKAGVDVISLARQFGDRLSFMGNIDIRVLESGDKQAIEAEIAGKMEALKSLGASYFFHTDHSVSPNVSFESYRHALEVYRCHCNYE